MKELNYCQRVGILHKIKMPWWMVCGSYSAIPLHIKILTDYDDHIHAGHQNIGKNKKTFFFFIQSVQRLLIWFIGMLTLEQQYYHTSQQHQQQSWGEPLQALSVQNCMQGFQSTALVCYWGNCLIWPAFMSQIGTAGCSSRKQDYAMKTASLVRTQSLRQCFSEKDSVGKQATPGSQSQSVWSGHQS